jgi:hypothetical protein
MSTKRKNVRLVWDRSLRQIKKYVDEYKNDILAEIDRAHILRFYLAFDRYLESKRKQYTNELLAMTPSQSAEEDVLIRKIEQLEMDFYMPKTYDSYKASKHKYDAQYKFHKEREYIYSSLARRMEDYLNERRNYDMDRDFDASRPTEFHDAVITQIAEDMLRFIYFEQLWNDDNELALSLKRYKVVDFHPEIDEIKQIKKQFLHSKTIELFRGIVAFMIGIPLQTSEFIQQQKKQARDDEVLELRESIQETRAIIDKLEIRQRQIEQQLKMAAKSDVDRLREELKDVDDEMEERENNLSDNENRLEELLADDE